MTFTPEAHHVSLGWSMEAFMTEPVHVGFLVFPNVTQLDFTGPLQVLQRLPGAVVHLVWHRIEPIKSDTALCFLPTTTMDECPQLDILCVPGGSGINALMEDDEALAFLRRQAAGARFVTSVCTGALVLGAAGLLGGYRATTHWASHDMLALFGATPVRQRVVIDRNRVTAGGVTGGIDFGLRLAALLTDEATAQGIQLSIEYDPMPPFTAGSPDRAPESVVANERRKLAGLLAERRAVAERVAGALFV
jgi:cyclohexyl-isocyanide hydratase